MAKLIFIRGDHNDQGSGIGVGITICVISTTVGLVIWLLGIVIPKS